MSRYLAFDLGASSGRAILGELGDDDKLTVSEVYRFPNSMIEEGGHLHWDIHKIINELYEGMRRCVGHPSSIGIDTWGVDFGLLDRNGALIGLPYTYRDPRTEGAVNEFSKKMPLKELYERTGIQVLTFDTLFQLQAAVRDEPENLQSASRLLMIADLLNYQLTGIPVSEFTLATTTHIYNPWERAWDEKIISTLGVPRRIFQNIVEPGIILGELTPDVMAATGFGKVPVASVACHDTGSAVAAVPADVENFAYISSGTWSLMGCESKKPIVNKESRKNNITNEGGVNHTFRVLKNIAGLWLVQECRRAWGNSYTYDELVALAEAAKPHLAVIDPDWEGFLNPSSMPEAISSYCRKSGQMPPKTPGEITRVTLESLSLAYKYTLIQLEEAIGRKIRCIHIVGGGSRNRLLNQFAAEATGKHVYAGPAEATAIGNLLVQAMASGIIKDLSKLRSIVRESIKIEEYEPGDLWSWDESFKKLLEVKEMQIV